MCINKNIHVCPIKFHDKIINLHDKIINLPSNVV